MNKYLPLYRWLAGQPVNLTVIPMEFKQVEQILSCPLPPTARNRTAWWANNPQRHVQANAWLSAGFSTEDVNLAAQTVNFVRN
ncbi:MAG: hypothetical protein JSS95_04460 [Acidobacteria bacterium]|nr:hypothetical protein [Acidobacteriota bacterium]